MGLSMVDLSELHLFSFELTLVSYNLDSKQRTAFLTMRWSMLWTVSMVTPTLPDPCVFRPGGECVRA